MMKRQLSGGQLCVAMGKCVRMNRCIVMVQLALLLLLSCAGKNVKISPAYRGEDICAKSLGVLLVPHFPAIDKRGGGFPELDVANYRNAYQKHLPGMLAECLCFENVYPVMTKINMADFDTNEFPMPKKRKVMFWTPKDNTPFSKAIAFYELLLMIQDCRLTTQDMPVPGRRDGKAASSDPAETYVMGRIRHELSFMIWDTKAWATVCYGRLSTEHGSAFAVDQAKWEEIFRTIAKSLAKTIPMAGK